MNTKRQETDPEESKESLIQEMIDDTLRERMKNISHKLLVLSGKGGVGKSTVAVNMAVALADAGMKVGLLDADLHGPSIPTLLGLQDQHAAMTEGGLIHPVEVTDHLKVISIAFLLRSGNDAVIWRGPLKFSAIRQLLRDVDWGELDYLVVDSPPGTGDEPLSVAQLVGSPSSAIIVTTPQTIAISDVRRCITFCSRLTLDVIGIVENMSGLVCPHCREDINLFSIGGGEVLAWELGIPFLGRIPIDPEVVISGDSGQPFVQSALENPATIAFSEVVQAVLKRTQKSDDYEEIKKSLENSA